MAGYDRPGGPGWPAPGFSDEFADPPLTRGRGWAPDDEPDYDYDYDYEFGPEPEPAHRRPSGDNHPRRSRSRGRRGNILWRWRRGLFIVALLVMSLIAGGVSVMAQVELPDPGRLDLSSFICTAEVPEGECAGDNAVARLSGEGNREYIRLEDMPPVMVDAVIATEDRTFFEHEGLDAVGIARALYRDLRGGGLNEGGSTITQQFVKNTYLQSERTVTRKIREAVLAIKVEQELSKEEILEGYLNTIYFGRHAYGIRAASRAYFGMDITNPEFGLEEASYLAALIRSPGHADAGDPEQLEEATRRRSTVLDGMVEEDYIDQSEQDLVEAMDLSTYVQPRQSYRLNSILWGGGANGAGMEYITAYVQDQVTSILREHSGFSQEEAEQELAAGGLRVYTTVDRTMQQQAYDAVYRNMLTDPATDPAAGLVSIDDQGQVRAMVGGRDFYADNDYGQNNFAVMGEAGRQVGSTFKPIAFATAVSNSISPERSYLQAPAEVQFPSIPGCDVWTAHNYSSEDAETGSLNLFQATAESSNTAYAQLMNQLTPEPVVNMAHDLGMDREVGTCLPTVLGSEGSSPLEMAEVYSTFANRGVHKEPTIITRIDQVDADGETSNLWRWQGDERTVLSETQADLVTYALQGVIDHGTGTNADIGKDAAGKTGSTSENKDAWFVGYVPRLTTAVWLGYPLANAPLIDEETGQQKVDANGELLWQIPPMRDLYGHSTITGGSLPARIWADFMTAATADMNDEFAEPTPEQREDGTVIGDGRRADDEQPADTVPQGPPETRPGRGPSTTLPDITIPEPPDTTSTTDTTLFPLPTSTPTTEPGDEGRGGSP
jgi:penicillin-binding protein 1A